MSEKPRKNLFNNSKIKLSAPNPNSKGKWAGLQFDVWNNNPRIVLNTNDPAMQSRSYGRFTAAMEPVTFMAFITLLERAVTNKETNKAFVEVHVKPKGSDMNAAPVHSADVVVGRDADGAVFIALAIKEEGWPMIKFVFGPPDHRFHKVRASTGEPFTKTETSDLYATAYVKLLTNGIMNVLDTHYAEPQPFGGRQSGGGGGYQQRNQGQQNYNNGGNSGGGGSDIKSDDLPF